MADGGIKGGEELEPSDFNFFLFFSPFRCRFFSLGRRGVQTRLCLGESERGLRTSFAFFGVGAGLCGQRAMELDSLRDMARNPEEPLNIWGVPYIITLGTPEGPLKTKGSITLRDFFREPSDLLGKGGGGNSSFFSFRASRSPGNKFPCWAVCP